MKVMICFEFTGWNWFNVDTTIIWS